MRGRGKRVRGEIKTLVGCVGAGSHGNIFEYETDVNPPTDKIREEVHLSPPRQHTHTNNDMEMLMSDSDCSLVTPISCCLMLGKFYLVLYKYYFRSITIIFIYNKKKLVLELLMAVLSKNCFTIKFVLGSTVLLSVT